MERFTKHTNIYSCRIIDCPAEQWIQNLTNVETSKWSYDGYVYMCDSCPFKKYINHLAELEDNMERNEDDLK